MINNSLKKDAQQFFVEFLQQKSIFWNWISFGWNFCHQHCESWHCKYERIDGFLCHSFWIIIVGFQRFWEVLTRAKILDNILMCRISKDHRISSDNTVNNNNNNDDTTFLYRDNIYQAAEIHRWYQIKHLNWKRKIITSSEKQKHTEVSILNITRGN